ncbi:MAG TPA: glycosyltransferase family 4 protein [Syntrophobacteraceae bacterium]|nr:glycosyltransferase family 4 protein [Syntrophobacteraceae bacterium]
MFSDKTPVIRDYPQKTSPKDPPGNLVQFELTDSGHNLPSDTSKGQILYHHRTQCNGAEGVHIRGMIDGFTKNGYVLDVVGPPGVNPYAGRKSYGKEDDSRMAKILRKISDSAPEPFFEGAEIAYNLYGHIKCETKIRRKRYDFIYERFSLNMFSTALLASKYQLPFVLEVNDSTLIPRTRRLYFSNLANKLENQTFRKADLIVTISNTFKDLIVHAHDISPEKILVLPNAVDPDRFSLDPDLRFSRESLRIEARHIIGCAGAFVPWHGLACMVEALSPIVRQCDIHILLIGDGPVRQEVESLAKNLNISDRVQFTGLMRHETVPYLLDLLDICIIPDSNAHGSPMKLFEFMASAKPVVAPRYQPILEIVTEGREGYLFDPGSATSLRECVEKLISCPAARKQMGKEAKQTVLMKHTWVKNAQRVLSVLEDKRLK